MRTRKVGQVMTREVVIVTPQTPYKDIVRSMARHRISGVPVVDSEDRVIGVVSEADLLVKEQYHESHRGRQLVLTRRSRRARSKAAAVAAATLMTAPAVTVAALSSIAEAARLMDRHQIKRLPVVDEAGRLVGIVSRRDLLRVFLRSDDEIRQEIVHEVFERSLWANPALVTVTVDDGIVTLDGTLERKTLVELAADLTRRIDGVVSVVNHLQHEWDDTKLGEAVSEEWRQRVG